MEEQHLYLLFDDWDTGYSVRKVSLSSRSDKRSEQPLSSGSGKEGVEPLPGKVSLSRRSDKRAEQPLPSGSGKEGLRSLLDDWDSVRRLRLWPPRSDKRFEPLPEVFMHIRAERGYPDMFTSAFGAKIMVMAPKIMVMDSDKADDTRAIPLINVKEQALTFGPLLGNCNACPIFFPVGDNRLFALDFGTFDSYLWTPEHSKEPWGWQDLPYPPFERGDVSSYGVQPDGCIFVSTTDSIGGPRTFILDPAKDKEYVWKLYGNWVFPFAGRGHYDTSLGAFVGLSKDGYICCRTMAASTTGTSPDVKHTKAKVYTEGRHVSATLVHMHPSKFCLVECISVDNKRTGQDLRESWAREFKVPLESIAWDCVGGGPQGGRCIYLIKTFDLSYDPQGDCLKLKNFKSQGGYSLPHEARIGSVCLDPVAFWL